MTHTFRSRCHRTIRHDAHRRWNDRRASDHGQTALVAVLALTLAITVTGGVLIQTIVQSSPLQQTQSVQIYASRALEAGANAYLVAVNANPSLAECNTGTNGTGTCGGLNYGEWNVVDNSAADGADAEYYAFGNPQPTFSTTTGALTTLTVEVVGAAYDASAPNHYVFDNETITVTPSNGFLQNVWWSNYESYNDSGNYSNCNYNWKVSYNISGAGLTCSPVYFGPGDYLNGPTFTNDSVFVSPTPAFGTTASPGQVTTADPHCLFTASGTNQGMNGNYSNCASVDSDVSPYNTTTSAYGHAVETPPQTDSQLGTIAQQNGCLYSGPTQITLSTNASGNGQMTVSSPDTPEQQVTVGSNTYTWDTNNISTNLNNCPNNGTATLPPNGVVFVQNANTAQTQAWSNPLDDPIYNTVTNLTSSPTPPTAGSSVTLTATVTSDGNQINAGATAAFSQTTCRFGKAPCSGGTNTSAISSCQSQPMSTPAAVTPATTPATYTSTATCTLTESTSGTGAFSATYSGGTYNTSSSGSLGQTNTLTSVTSYGPDSQVTAGGCQSCYYGQTSTPDSEGDAFVSNAATNGGLSGQLTIGTANNIIIDGNLTYNDCDWTNGPGGAANSGTASQSFCQYNKTGTNDSLGLIAYNYVEVGHPVLASSTTGHNPLPQLLASCSTPGALCDPSDSNQNITIDAAILALTQSFVVNNYANGSAENLLIVYGSVQQFARGPVGTFNALTLTTVSGYTKHYTWDPLLNFISPPSYLVPSTPSWVLGSSSANAGNESATACPPIQAPYPPSGVTISSYCGAAPTSGGLTNY
ncbi:MAG: hypothetical protein ACLQOZ_08880 [Acidimicrobiales bacterium]